MKLGHSDIWNSKNKKYLQYDLLIYDIIYILLFIHSDILHADSTKHWIWLSDIKTNWHRTYPQNDTVINGRPTIQHNKFLYIK